ncbi:MAG: alpha/beta fold hydrolase [Alphaproteobacteria bacterium]
MQGATARSGETESPADTIARIRAQAERVETPVGGGRMVWHVWGEGEPLVLLHGSFGAWTHWVRNIEALAARYRVIAGDIPGMGDSDEPAQPFTIDSLADEVSAGLDIVVPPPAGFHFAGFSFGGIVGGHVCARQAARVRTYTALGSNALGLPLGDRATMAKPSSRMSEAEILDVHRHNLGITMIAAPERIDDLALHIQTTNTRRARLRSGDIPRGDSLARRLAELPCPIQGIWGERDQTAGPHVGARRDLFRAIQPGCAFHFVPGAGHWVPFEAAEATNRHLLDFLAAHPIRRGA